MRILIKISKKSGRAILWIVGIALIAIIALVNLCQSVVLGFICKLVSKFILIAGVINACTPSFPITGLGNVVDGFIIIGVGILIHFLPDLISGALAFLTGGITAIAFGSKVDAEEEAIIKRIEKSQRKER